MHLWFENLHEEVVTVFATAYTYSATKSNRVSTERFLSALPERYKDQVVALCRAANNELKLRVPNEPPELPFDWQDQVCFSTCIESTLHKCTDPGGVSLVEFLKKLCQTAVRLHCIVDKNMPVDDYLTSALKPPALVAPPFAPPPPPPLNVLAMASKILVDRPTPPRWLMDPSTFSVDEILPEDVLRVVMRQAGSVEALRTCKAVCSTWRQVARQTLCDVGWLLERHVSLHQLLKKGNPTPRLALALASARPGCMHERDGEGLLPLQFAAAYRLDPALVAALRQATALQVPRPASGAEARAIKSQLRPVHTHVAHGPIAAA